jgi:hypothetical protein
MGPSVWIRRGQRRHGQIEVDIEIANLNGLLKTDAAVHFERHRAGEIEARAQIRVDRRHRHAIEHPARFGPVSKPTIATRTAAHPKSTLDHSERKRSHRLSRFDRAPPDSHPPGSIAWRAAQRGASFPLRSVLAPFKPVATVISLGGHSATRPVSPLAVAADATVIDTTGVPVDRVVEQVLALVTSRSS